MESYQSMSFGQILLDITVRYEEVHGTGKTQMSINCALYIRSSNKLNNLQEKQAFRHDLVMLQFLGHFKEHKKFAPQFHLSISESGSV